MEEKVAYICSEKVSTIREAKEKQIKGSVVEIFPDGKISVSLDNVRRPMKIEKLFIAIAKNGAIEECQEIKVHPEMVELFSMPIANMEDVVACPVFAVSDYRTTSFKDLRHAIEKGKMGAFLRCQFSPSEDGESVVPIFDEEEIAKVMKIGINGAYQYAIKDEKIVTRFYKSNYIL